MENDSKIVFVSTLDSVPNSLILESKGLIYESKYVSSDIDHLINQLKKKAFNMGCNAILNFKIMTKDKYDDFVYGEAVKIENIYDIAKGPAPSLTEKPK